VKILFADDDTDFLDVTSYSLRPAGFDVETVANGAQALDAMHQNDPDLVLLDVKSPEGTGVKLCEAIRTTSQVPVVFLSKDRRETEIILAFAAGADDYVIKPVGPQHLAMRLQAIVKRSKGRKADVSPRHLVVPPLVIDLDSFDVTFDGQPVRLTRL